MTDHPTPAEALPRHSHSQWFVRDPALVGIPDLGRCGRETCEHGHIDHRPNNRCRWCECNDFIESARSTPAQKPLDVAEVYTDRNLVVQAFAQLMEESGYPVWWGVDESEPDWPVLYIEGPTGQLSWHIPKAERIYEPPVRPEHAPLRKWDGHTTHEKFERIRATLLDQSAD